MGSFRIVTGSGYGRREITAFRDVQREFSKLRNVAEVTSAHPPRVRSKKAKSSSKGITSLYDKLWDDAVRKANKWARETAAEMRASVPVDTGNLRESIHVLEKDCVRNKLTGEIIMAVGVDLDPYGGRGKLYAPPHRKKSSKYGRKTSPWKGYRIMPSYPHDYSYKFLDSGALHAKFSALSKKNAKKIMGK